MRIAYDTQIFWISEFGGVARYFASLARELHKMPDVDPRIFAPFHINAYLDRLPDGIVWGRRFRRLPRGNALIRAAGKALVFPAARVFDPHIVHETYYSPQPSAPRRARHVVTVYDMIHEIFQTSFPAEFERQATVPAWKREAVLRADHVICISEQTRRDLLEIHPIAEEKVSVTHLACDAFDVPRHQQDGRVFRRHLLGTDSPYVLYVGTRSGYKNFATLLKAYADSEWLRRNFYLLCFGGGEFDPGEHARMAMLGVADRIVQVGGGDDLLALCYQHASVFAYPSLYEGFGMPPLEAMSMDCAVACSETSSIPEVVGDAGAYFDPRDVDSIKTAIENVLQSEAYRAELIARGRRRREVFSWQRCARETLAIYRRVAGG